MRVYINMIRRDIIMDEKKKGTKVQYAATVFLGILTCGSFGKSIPAGIILLLATLLACPVTRCKLMALIEKISGGKVALTKLNGWTYTVAVVVLFFVGLSMIPTELPSDEGMVAIIEETTQPTTLIKEETNESEQIQATETSVQEELSTEEAVLDESVAEKVSVESENVQEVTQTIEEQSIALAENVKATESTETIPETNTSVSDMEVHFIDVGQGDATLIKADGQYMLIDAGDNNKGTAVQLYLQKQGVTKLDYLILTHTDADHIGGADVIVTKFDIDTVFMGDYKKDNKTYSELISAFEYKTLKYSIPKVGEEYTLGNASFKIVAPNKSYNDPNNSSIALLLKNGDNTFLFTGDCEEEAENDILANGINIDCDVYKLGHHGSRTASTQEFLNASTPMYGVVSCAEGNSYGHPHAEPLNNLRAMGVQVFRTDEQGSIIAYSDGKEIKWNCAPSETWKVGENTEPVKAPEPTPTPEPVPVPEPEIVQQPTETVEVQEYVIANKNSKAFHRPSCTRLPKEKNRVIYNSREEALAAGYNNPCDHCDP